MFGEFLDHVRKTSPLIHCITNYVTVNDVANMVLAAGASPIMADDPKDAKDIVSICQGLTINIGTLNERKLKAIFLAGEKARELGMPILLDPVGVSASGFRKDAAVKILQELKPTAIRANISEIKALAKQAGSTKGVDAAACDLTNPENLEQHIALIKEFSRSCESIVAVSGTIDIISDGTAVFLVKNGQGEMRSITGTGCQLSALMTSFLAANRNDYLNAAVAADIAMGLAGEIAWDYMQPGDGNATYRNRIIDAVYNMNGAALDKGANYESR